MRNGIDYAKMKRRVTAKVGQAVAKLYDFEPVTASVKEGKAEVFKVVATFSGFSETPAKKDLFNALASATDCKAAPIENSFRKIPSSNSYVGFMAKNYEVRVYEPEGMRVLASNLLMDETDNSLWEVRSNDDAKFLVRQQEDDLSDLVALASVKVANRNLEVPVLSSLSTPVARENEVAAYVDEKTLEVSYGIILAANEEEAQIINMETKEVANVKAEYIIELASFDYKETQKEFSAVAVPEIETASSMEDYWFKVYGQFPEFWAEFKKILEDRAVV